MTEFDRRQLLAGAAAMGAVAALSPLSTARAAVPPSGAQAPGFDRDARAYAGTYVIRGRFR
jgi:hypothetical protein